MSEHEEAPRKSADELSQGAYTCDICGQDTPHYHDDERVEIERLIRPAFEKTVVPRGWFNKETRFGPYRDGNTEALWQHFVSGWFAAKRALLAATPSEPTRRGKGMEYYAEGLDEHARTVKSFEDVRLDAKRKMGDRKVEEGQTKYERDKEWCDALFNTGEPPHVICEPSGGKKILDNIVNCERELADKLAAALRHMICGEDCDGCADNRAAIALYDAARKS